MPAEASRLVIVIRPGVRTRSILAWLRQLVPAALLVISAANPAPPAAQDAVVVDDDDAASGPLSLADALARRLARPATGADPASSARAGDDVRGG